MYVKLCDCWQLGDLCATNNLINIALCVSSEKTFFSSSGELCTPPAASRCTHVPEAGSGEAVPHSRASPSGRRRFRPSCAPADPLLHPRHADCRRRAFRHSCRGRLFVAVPVCWPGSRSLPRAEHWPRRSWTVTGAAEERALPSPPEAVPSAASRTGLHKSSTSCPGRTAWNVLLPLLPGRRNDARAQWYRRQPRTPVSKTFGCQLIWM